LPFKCNLQRYTEGEDPGETPNPDVSFADSDADGKFTLLDVDPGMYEIVVTRPGYLPSVVGLCTLNQVDR
jgi:hypothetical protein